jgi:2'-5' RNA ligase
MTEQNEWPPLFSTFDEAWQVFLERPVIVGIEDQREGFLRGRAQFLAMQVSIADMPVGADVEEVCEQLADIDGLIMMPPEALHISVRGVGFQVIASAQPGDVLREDVPRIGERVAKALRGQKPIPIELGPVNVFPDALILEVRPVEEMRDLLRRVDEAIGGQDAFPYGIDRYLPHVTIATFRNRDVVPALRERLPALREQARIADTIRRLDYARWWFTGHDVTAAPELDIVRSYRLK